MAGEASGAAFAATWRDERGEVVATTWAGSMCRKPWLPWFLKFAGDGYEGVLPCGECDGCLEFQRQRMARRLHAKYGAQSDQLFVARIYVPIEKRRPLYLTAEGEKRTPRKYRPDPQVRMAHALHRRRALQLEPGIWRLGASSFALVSRERALLERVLKTAGVKFRIEPLRLSRGRRAFRVLTAGLLVAREIYGEQRNRWYARGLPPAEREKWEVQKIAHYQSYDRARSPRARTGRRVVLVPPAVWKLSRTDRRSLRGLLMRQPDPEGVRKVMGLVADTIRKASGALHVSAPAKPVLTREQVARWYARNAEASKARTTMTESDPSLPPLSEAGGYVSSEHSQGELMPRELEKQRRREWEERRKQKAVQESMEIIERMKRRSGGGQD